jgi:Amt family ammonium transporter
MAFIKYVLRVPLRMSDEELEAGDDMIHGEAAYVLGPCEAHEHLLAGNYIKRSETGPGELSMGGVTMGHDPHNLPETKPVEKNDGVGAQYGANGGGSTNVKND